MLKRLLPIAFGLLCLVLGAYAASLKYAPPNPDSKQAIQSNDAAELLLAKSFPDHNGAEQNFSQWKGKLLVVNFWATWCSPCVKEMPELSAMQEQLKTSGIQFIGMGIDSPANIKDFAKKYQITYPLLLAGIEGSELSRKLGNQAGGLPFTILISGQGKLLKTYLGRLNMEDLHADLQKFNSSQVQH